MHIFYGLMIPFLGTVLGSACVFFMGQHINEKLQKLLLGFASGVMVAASVWSLIIPSIESSTGRTKQAESWPSGLPAFINVGLLGIKSNSVIILKKISSNSSALYFVHEQSRTLSPCNRPNNYTSMSRR